MLDRSPPQIQTTDAAKLTLDEVRHLVVWCNCQTENLWLPYGHPPLTVKQILALYHATIAADYGALEDWWEDTGREGAAAQVYRRILGGGS